MLSLALAVGGCCSYDFPHTDTALTVQMPVSAPATRDRSGEFRALFCRRGAVGEASGSFDCDDYFYFPPAEVDPGAVQAAAPITMADLHVVLVPGILGECIIDEVAPYQDSIPALQEKYPSLEFVTLDQVGGRASSRYNAAVIADYFENADIAEGKQVVVIGYSKGATDFLHYLAARREDAPARVDAFVSVAGVVAGTPIADINDRVGNAFIGHFPLDECPVRDGGGLDDLSTRRQLPWLGANLGVFANGMRFYSVTAASSPDRTSSIFYAFSKQLRGAGGSNDGQVPVSHQVLPGSDVLGTLHSDHWALVLPFENRKDSELGWMNRLANSLANHNHFPREVLLESVLLTVSGDLD